MLYNYVDTNLDDNLICCICRTPFNEPVTTRTCFHTFCQECILEALSVSNHCPIDRSPLSVELLGQADPIVRHLVEELTVRCPYLGAGCEYTGERHLLGSHLKLQCPYVQVPCLCSDESCKRTVARKDAPDGRTASHEGPDSELDNVQTMACESCGKEFPSIYAAKNHLANFCPEKIVSCGQAENGCSWKSRRLSLKTHVEQCPYESIKGFFAIHNTKMAQLSKDNERLWRRTEELGGVVRILKQELGWAKLALGPWYRPVYTERPPLTTNYIQYPNDEDASAGQGATGVRLMLPRVMDPIASGTSRPEPRVENGATEAFGFFDPFSFVGQTRNHDANIHAANNAPTTTTVTSAEPNLQTRASSHAVESGNSHDPNGDTISGPGYSNGSETIQNPTASVLSPGTRNFQSTSAAPATALFSDHFPPENRAAFEESGSSSLPQGWQHALSSNSMPSSPNPGIHSPDQPPISTSIHSHLASSHLVPCNRPQFTPSINKHTVAPLNLSTTVEGSLVGLRESLVTLSEALESQGRRLELALTAEGLRVNEEVGSLKAIVQGLRMQVHAMMMDRNGLVTGRIGGTLNVPSNLGVRPQQSPGPGGLAGGEDSNEGPGPAESEVDGRSSPGGPRFTEWYCGNGGSWGFPPQQPVPPGFTIPMVGPNFLIGPPLPGVVRFNHANQGGMVIAGGGLPLGGLPMSPHHLFLSPAAGSGPKL